MKITAVILAGGKNLRMKGKDKAFLVIDKKPIIERQLAALRKNFKEILIVTNSPSKYRKFKVRTVGDSIKGIGPLGGIYTGLKTINTEAAFFIACDMPFLHNDIIKRQLNFFNRKELNCLVVYCGSIQPLHSIYTKEMLFSISRSIAKEQLSIKKFLNSYRDKKVIRFPMRYKKCFLNVNTPQELRNLNAES
jgi:molybdopterin-guanine dinucleotide biosynthesis protein A